MLAFTKVQEDLNDALMVRRPFECTLRRGVLTFCVAGLSLYIPHRLQDKGVFVHLRIFRIVVIAGLFSATNQWAQLTVSTLRGTATDQAGAVVVKAQITVVNQSTNLTRTIETNSNSDFEIVDLVLGTYRLSATHPGFKTFVADNIVLESSQVRRVNVAFELGAVGTEVTVHADAAVIATESGTIQTTFDKQRFEEAPLIGDARNPQTVLVSLPMLQNAGSLYSIEFAGQSGNQIQSGIDGHTNNGVGNQIDNVHDVQETVAVAVNNSAAIYHRR